jgi:hypothetical protein
VALQSDGVPIHETVAQVSAELLLLSLLEASGAGMNFGGVFRDFGGLFAGI